MADPSSRAGARYADRALLAYVERVLPDGGKLWSLELEPKHAEVARANIAAAGLAHKVEIRVGQGAKLLPELARLGPFDAVFLDADKEGYAEYARWAEQNLRPGG